MGKAPPSLGSPPPPPALTRGLAALAEGEAAGEELWIDVIRQMDTVYADLVTSQTALEEQHRALVAAHDLIGSLFESMADVVLASDAKGRIERINGALGAIVGRAQDSLVGEDVTALFDPAEQDSVREGMAHVRGGGTVDQREWHLMTADGARATVSINIAARKDGRGEFAGYVFVGRPLGELQRAYRDLDEAHRRLTQTQEQLLTSEKMAALGRLVAGVAHELNNPISFVFGNMYSLKRYGEVIARYLDAADQRERDPELEQLRRELRLDSVLADIGPLVEGTLEGAERVRDIVQDLRRFSSNQQEVPEPFNAVRLVMTAADWVVKACRIAPQFRFELPDHLEITCRKGHLHQILVNLIQNACDALAGQADAQVTIRLAQHAGQVSFEVADNGPGIDAAHRDKIFEPFFTTKPIGSGTGLGLYVSYNMAGKMGGTLAFSDNVGGGTRFVLSLPVEAGQ